MSLRNFDMSKFLSHFSKIDILLARISYLGKLTYIRD